MCITVKLSPELVAGDEPLLDVVKWLRSNVVRHFYIDFHDGEVMVTFDDTNDYLDFCRAWLQTSKVT